jgi:hypothetical protein
MTHTPTLDPDRFEQLRTFLTAEAAQAAGSRGRALVGWRRRLAVGAIAAMAVGSVLAVSTLRPGGTDPALAISTEGEWTTVRLADVDADPQAVVDELVAAGIDARIAPIPDALPPGYGMGVGVFNGTSDETAYGLSIAIPAGFDSTGGPEPAEQGLQPEPAEQGLRPDPFESHGVRFGDSGDVAFSIRSGSDAVVLVHPQE